MPLNWKFTAPVVVHLLLEAFDWIIPAAILAYGSVKPLSFARTRLNLYYRTSLFSRLPASLNG